MNILIVTKSFVREVSYLVRYATHSELPLNFSVVMPSHNNHEEPLPASVVRRTLFFSKHIRAACYSPLLLSDIHTYRPDILHIFEEYSSLLAFQALLFKQLICRKSKIMVYSAENIQGNVNPVFRFPMKYVMNRADLAFVCSHSVKHVLKHEGFSKPIEVFPLGVDPSRFHKFPVNQLKKQLNLDGKFVIGYSGRLLTFKGVFFLLEMMRDLPEDVHLLMVGTGPEEKELQTTAAKYHLENRVHLVGNVPYAQLPEYINCMDIGIVPSRTTKRWKEQFGRVIVELMSCEVPVIGSDSGSIPEVLGDAGHLFHEKNLQELLTIVKTLRESTEMRQHFGKLGRKRAITYYSTEIMCEQLLSMYRKLM